MKVDFKTEKTEKEWQTSFDKFIIKATHKWFTWIGWVLILGALSILYEKTQSITIKIIYAITFVLFIFYFISYFYQFEFKNIPFVKSKNIVRMLSILISALLSWALLLLFTKLKILLNINGP